MKNLLIIATCLVSCHTISAQFIQSVSGTVVDNTGRKLFGNAIALSPNDSSIVTGKPFYDGQFELTGLKQQKILLKFSSLEFEDQYLVVLFEGNSFVNLGDLVISNAHHELDEVVVTSKSPLVDENADGSVAVNVAGTALATSTSVSEILTRSPGILADEDGNMSLFGKGQAIILINGVRVTSNRLSTLSPSLIEKIDLISNPGPQYDAEGNAVINIITKKDALEGSVGMIKNYMTHSYYGGPLNRTDANYSITRRKWTLNSNYGLELGQSRHMLETTRTRDTSEDYFRSDLTTKRKYLYTNFSNYALGLQYEFNDRDYLSAQYTGAYEAMGGSQNSHNEITYEGNAVYESELKRDNQTLKHNFSTNYYKGLDSVGSGLFVGGQYSAYTVDFQNDIHQISSEEDIRYTDAILNIGGNNTNIFSVQTDYTQILSNDYSLEMGLKLGSSTIASNTTFYDLSEEAIKTLNEDLSNEFNYKERVPAVYLNLKGKFDQKTTYSVGIRSEYTFYRLQTSVRQGQSTNDRYLNWFPGLSITSQLFDETSFFLSYSSRINRAPYEALNPFVLYQDKFTSVQGNPNLKPSLIHSIEIGTTHVGWSLKTGYTYTLNPIDGGAFQSKEDPKVYILQRTNLTSAKTLLASISKNINIRGLRSINTAKLSYSHLTDHKNGFGSTTNHPYFYLYSQNSFDIQNWFTVYLTAWYQSALQDGINNELDYSSVNIGIEKKLLKDRLKINIDFNDIFHEVRYDGYYTLGQTDIVYRNTVSTNYVRCSLTFNFGNLKDVRYKNKEVGASETSRAR